MYPRHKPGNLLKPSPQKPSREGDGREQRTPSSWVLSSDPVNPAVGRGLFMVRHKVIRFTVCLVAVVVTRTAHPGALSQVVKEHAKPDTAAHHSLLSYSLDEVVVTSSRIPSTAGRSPAPISLISRIDIERSGATSLGDILVSGPGLFVKDYGPASGLKTLSQRGLGTEHTLILMNGMPVYSMQNGSIDFGAFPSEEIDRVELVRGGQSASFGANAVAGVVNVVTRSMRNENVVARLSTGAFGERDVSVSVGNDNEKLRWRMSSGLQKFEGGYPFQFTNGPVSYDLVRTNAQRDAWRCSGDLEAALSPTVRLHTTALYLESERGVPGIVSSPFSSSRATQRDQQGIVQLGLLRMLSLRSWWEAKVQGVYSYQRYADPDIVVGGIPIINNFRNTEGRVALQFHADASGLGRYTIGGDAVHATGEGNAVSGSPLREQWGMFIAGERSLGLAPDSSVVVSFHPVLRYDRVQEIGDAFSPQLGLQVLLLPMSNGGEQKHLLRLHGTVGRNFRTPTFNELFYAGGGGRGNPHLRPERSTAFDLGTGITVSGLGQHEFDLTWFGVEMQDRIVWTSAGAGSTTPKNLRNVVVKGIECTYAWRWTLTGTTVSVSYSRSKSEKTSSDFPGDPNLHTIVPYSPQELLSWSVGWGDNLALGPLRECAVSLGCSRVGFRYTTEDNASYLPSHTVFNATTTVGLRVFGTAASMQVDIRNLLNESYVVMLGYPMPLRSYRFSLTLSY